MPCSAVPESDVPAGPAASAGEVVLVFRWAIRVAPCTGGGTERVQPVGRRPPRIRRVTVRNGSPLGFSRYEGLEGSGMIRRAVTDEIMDAIAQLSQQEYVDTYHGRPAA
jgi:1-acyl-sn-glycerol-3-phosphate acyltransferase